jgi:hypothetical protein
VKFHLIQPGMIGRKHEIEKHPGSHVAGPAEHRFHPRLPEPVGGLACRRSRGVEENNEELYRFATEIAPRFSDKDSEGTLV